MAAAAAALDRAASFIGVPRRLAWAGAIVTVLVAPLPLVSGAHRSSRGRPSWLPA
ncbi:MAG TPA: hypothetical protein VH277_06875 [Gemmatimonadaceae bacterium]|nr:hypothetical protein [Gemmatimonadaceae bacterium]